MVEKQYLFYGPLKLIGISPFIVNKMQLLNIRKNTKNEYTIICLNASTILCIDTECSISITYTSILNNTLSAIRAIFCISLQYFALVHYFRKELKNYQVPKSEDPGDSYLFSKWPYFKSMTFLKDQFISRKSTEN